VFSKIQNRSWVQRPVTGWRISRRLSVQRQVLTGHASVLQQRAFDARARPPSERPSHAAVSLSELQFSGDPASPVTHRRRRNRHRRE
jgi:hypothetical protein